MNFLEPIQTTLGPGLVVAKTVGGGVLVATTKERVVHPENGKPLIVRTHPHQIFTWCALHQVWFADRCPECDKKEEQ